MTTKKKVLLLLAVLYLLHNDYWNWSNSSLLGGLPAGLLYHMLYCLLTAAVMASVVHFAWPDDLNDGESE